MSIVSPQYTTFNGYGPYSEAGPYVAADYWGLPEGEPVELIRGRLIVSPAPNSLHQYISGQLWRVMQRAERRGGGVAFYSPIDVVLDDRNVLQPDIVYLGKDRLSLVADTIKGPPSLVVEITSPSTANRDRQEKLDIYRRFAVPEYWIVDPASRTIEFLVYDSGRYVVVTPIEGVYRSSASPELVIRTTRFWEAVERLFPQHEA